MAATIIDRTRRRLGIDTRLRDRRLAPIRKHHRPAPGDVVNKRVAVPGRGKSSDPRPLVATRRGARWFFVFGFEKSERANVSSAELEALQTLASELLALSGSQLDEAVDDGALQEMGHDR